MATATHDTHHTLIALTPSLPLPPELHATPPPRHPSPMGPSRHICSLQPRPTLSALPRPPAPMAWEVSGSSRARETLLFKFWLRSFQHSPDSTACVGPGSRGMERGAGGPSGGHVGPGVNPRSWGGPCSPAHRTPQLPDETSPEACSPWEQAALSALGGWVSESGVKSSVGAAESGQGLLLSFYNIFTRS